LQRFLSLERHWAKNLHNNREDCKMATYANQHKSTNGQTKHDKKASSGKPAQQTGSRDFVNEYRMRALSKRSARPYGLDLDGIR